jgi:hypothetical protein
VHCPECEQALAELSDSRQMPLTDSERLPAWLADVMCARCGALLLSEDPDRHLLTKLAQLSRFGLGADDRRLFDDAADGRGDRSLPGA